MQRLRLWLAGAGWVCFLTLVWLIVLNRLPEPSSWERPVFGLAAFVLIALGASLEVSAPKKS